MAYETWCLTALQHAMELQQCWGWPRYGRPSVYLDELGVVDALHYLSDGLLHLVVSIDAKCQTFWSIPAGEQALRALVSPNGIDFNFILHTLREQRGQSLVAASW